MTQLAATSAEAGQLVDFAVLHPALLGKAIVIEVDGDQHQRGPQSTIDRQREAALRASGHEIFRIPAHEVRAGHGPSLEALESRLREVPPWPEWDRAPMAAAHAALALFHLLQENFLSPDMTSWSLAIGGPVADAVKAGLRGAHRVLRAFCALYGAQEPPELHIVETPPPDIPVVTWDDTTPWWAPPHAGEPDRPRVELRPAWRPSIPSLPPSPPQWIDPNPDVAQPLLRDLLHSIFPDKENFWEGQEEGLRRCLAGRDTLVLLPTGGGKSLIYQLAAHLLPGFTLVVSPLVALMEDQLDNLERAGIDRAVHFSSRQTRAGTAREAETALAGGCALLCYVAPERLQIRAFRDTLRQIVNAVPLPLVVIDEAHCLSEWGHDFRPAYLNLARNARTLGRRAPGTPPALVGLTGTASRAVLRDVQIDLGIQDIDATITPSTFDRPELEFDVRSVQDLGPDAKYQVLKGILQALPGHFHTDASRFYQPRGTDSACGIVFCIHKKGPYGVHALMQKLARDRPDIPLGVYHGGPDNTQVGEDARRFKDNDITLLVATKAYGMGIDKPNVRYTIHYNLPPSLEALYQEAGRAGRDRKKAYCHVIATIVDNPQTAALLDPGRSVEDVQDLFEKTRNRETEDDIRRVLFFHFKQHDGARRDFQQIMSVVDALGDLSTPDLVSLSYSDEKAQVHDQNLRKLQHALHRLILLRVVRDYTVDYSHHAVAVQKAPATHRLIADGLFSYVRAYSRPRAQKIIEELGSPEGSDIRDFLSRAAQLLLRFIYDTIELGRRAAIRTVAQWARKAVREGPQAARQELLAYLQETEFSRDLAALLQAPEVSHDHWDVLLDRVASKRDLQELLGAAQRALEDYPDHPGVLGLRALAEARAASNEDAVAYARAASRAASMKYATTEQHADTWIRWMLDAAWRFLEPPTEQAIFLGTLPYCSEATARHAYQNARTTKSRLLAALRLVDIAVSRLSLLNDPVQENQQ